MELDLNTYYGILRIPALRPMHGAPKIKIKSGSQMQSQKPSFAVLRTSKLKSLTQIFSPSLLIFIFNHPFPKKQGFLGIFPIIWEFRLVLTLICFVC